MLNLVVAILVLALGRLGVVKGQYVDDGHVRVFLFGHAAYFSEVAVDVSNNTCLSLDNNMIDGKVISVLVGGHDIWDVYKREDGWYCTLYDNYGCQGPADSSIDVAGGENNLQTVGWAHRVHAIRCINEG